MEIDVLAGTVQPVDKTIVAKAQERFDNLIKPVGSLAKLEEMATRYAAIYGSALVKQCFSGLTTPVQRQNICRAADLPACLRKIPELKARPFW